MKLRHAQPTLHNYLITLSDGSRWRTGYVYGTERRVVSGGDELPVCWVGGETESSDDVCADPAGEVALLVDGGEENLLNGR